MANNNNFEINNHQCIKEVNGKISIRAKNISPIHTMHERAILNVAQYSAGTALFNYWREGWCGYSSAEIKERVDGCVEKEITTRQIHAQKQFEKARKAVKRNWHLLEQVVINEIPLTKRGMGGHERKQLIYHFRRALNDVARCYGFLSEL